MTPRCSIVVPIYRDGRLAPAFCEELSRVMRGWLKQESLRDAVELIFVNDGSRDDSLQTLLALRARFDFVRVIDLSRNFGQHQAIACGLREARGTIVLRMNVDMQDPPAEIPRLLEAMAEGDFDLVVGQYDVRRHPPLVRLTARLYYALFHLLTGFDAPQDTSPLRAMSRRYVEAYNSLPEKSRFPQGLDQWLGFRQKYLRTEHRARADGGSSYTFWSRLKLALNGILYFSDRPLKLIAVFGLFAACGGLLLAGWLIIGRLLGVNYLPGWFSIAAIALVAFGLQLMSTGVVGLYVGRIFSEVQNRPLYLVRERYDQPALEARAEEPQP